MAKRDEGLLEFGKILVISGPAAIGFAVGSNEILRRTGLGYVSRAGIQLGVGLASGGGVAYAGAPRVGAGLAVGGLLGGFINGVNAINVRMYRGKAVADTRAALPGAGGNTLAERQAAYDALPAASQAAAGARPTNGTGEASALPSGAPGVSTMAPSPSRDGALAFLRQKEQRSR